MYKSSIVVIVAFILFSCHREEKMQLPKSGTTVLKTMTNHSPVYFTFEATAKDTTISVNRTGTISTTNWIFNIDQRLPLRLVIPEVLKLQLKKETSAHKDEESQNYYSYADTVSKNLAFLAFTKVQYHLEKPTADHVVFFSKNKQILVDQMPVEKTVLKSYLEKLLEAKFTKVTFCFDKNSSYGTYIQNKIFIQTLGLGTWDNQEYVF
jgi:biopolymer transport protein ExbD